MSANFYISLLFAAGLGAFLAGLLMDPKSSFNDGSFIWEIMTIGAGMVAMATAVLAGFIHYMLG